jgi:hypothetical protein
LDLPRHLFHFTPKTIGILLSRCGFTDINISRYSSEQTILFSLGYYLQEKKIIRSYNVLFDSKILNILRLPLIFILNFFGMGDLMGIRARKI